jgi:hypothetical protein
MAQPNLGEHHCNSTSPVRHQREKKLLLFFHHLPLIMDHRLWYGCSASFPEKMAHGTGVCSR